jgi:hypothetical protein
VQPEFGLRNGFGALARDEDLLRVSALSIERAVAVRLREGWREVDCRVRCRLNELDVLPVAATDDLVQRKLVLDSIDNPSKLRWMSATRKASAKATKDLEAPYQLVDVNEHASLGVLRGEHISVYSHSPPLVPPQLYVTVQSVHQRSQLGPQQEYVDAAIQRDLVQVICH